MAYRCKKKPPISCFKTLRNFSGSTSCSESQEDLHAAAANLELDIGYQLILFITRSF